MAPSYASMTSNGMAKRWQGKRPDSGMYHRPAIELRNHLSEVPTLLDDGEGNTVYVVIQRDTHRPRGVRDPEHAWTLYAREPGDPVNWP